LDFELDGRFPLPIEELVYDYVVLERDSERGAKLLCSAVDRTWFETFLKELQEAGANPRIVCMDTLAAGELLEHAASVSAYDKPQETDAVALIDIGHMTTSICIVRGDVVELVRTIKRGGHDITRALMQSLNVSYLEAEEIKHRSARLDGHETDVDDLDESKAIRDTVMRVLEPLLRDLRTTLHAHASKQGLGVVRGLLYGGTSRLPGLQAMLSRELKLQLEMPHCFSFSWAKEDLSDTGEEVAPKAVSLALRYVTDGQKESVNFRQGDLAFESDFKALKDKWVWLTVMAVLLIGVFFTKIALQKSALEENQALLSQTLASYTEETLGEPLDDFAKALERVRNPPKVEGESVVPAMTAIQAYYEIWQATQKVRRIKSETPEDEGGSTSTNKKATDEGSGEAGSKDSEGKADDEEKVDEFGIQIERIQLPAYGKIGQVQGTVNSLTAMTAFQDILDKHECMEITQDPDYKAGSVGRRAAFTIRLRIACPEKEEEGKDKHKTKAGDKKAPTSVKGEAGGS
jgi:type IV pilus assembly protein PilM